MNEDMDDEIPQSQRQADLQIARRAAEQALPLVEVGYTFKNEWLDAVLGIPRPKFGTAKEFDDWGFRRMGLVDIWRDLLLAEHGVHVENARGKGYAVIDPRLTSQVVHRAVKRESAKIWAQAFDKLTLTTAEGLTDADIAARHNEMAWLGRMKMMLESQRPRPPKPSIKRVIEAAPPQEE